MGISCSSCGGKMVFDIESQCLVCSFCDTRKTIEEYKADNEAEEQKTTYDAVVFTCRNCGAELTAPDEQAVAYCSYCGSEQMLTAKHEELLRPKQIIPFQKSKLQAKDAYSQALKGKLYVPKEFKDPQFLEGFRGIYLPYFSYSAVIPDKEVLLKGSADYSRGSYDYHEEYDVYASLSGRTEEVTFDASAAFDDMLSNSIAPFEANDMKDFHDGYLAGFYADKATSSVGSYMEDATVLAAESVYTEIEKDVPKVTLEREGTAKEQGQQLGIGAVDCEVSLFPVWFLTWRNKNRVAYSVMNGQTGKIAMDIPVNKKTFFLVSLIAAIVLFALLSILPIFILPKSIANISALILFASGLILRNLIKKIYEKECHIYDYGDGQHSGQKKKQIPKKVVKKSSSKTSMSTGTVIVTVIFFLFVAFYVFGGMISGLSALGSLFSRNIVPIFLVMFILQTIFSILTIVHAAKLERKLAIAPAIISMLVLLAGVVIGFINPANDFYYYGVALAGLVAVILNALSCINYFNYLTTRPVPNFFRREGADNA